jgi:CRISPR-associated protein Csm2
MAWEDKKGQGGLKYPPRQHDGAGKSIDSTLSKIIFTKNALPRDIFSDVAQEAAKIISESCGLNANKSSQLRRFYDELLMWNDAVQQVQSNEGREGKYKELEPFIKMLKAKVAYAKGRNHVDGNFEKLFSRCIDSIDSHESLRYCKLFMEAFTGYYKVEKGD